MVRVEFVAAFSRIVGNHIYNIASNKQLKGPELGGIKFHGAIDVLIQGNRIHHTEKGLFLDWMTQGTRITGNLFYDNVVEDLYMEVNHGPYIVDNNIFGSPFNLWDMSDGGAFVHNLFLGKIRFQPEHSRYTPYHLPHSTGVAGISIIIGGDDRFYNNVFLPSRLADGEKIAGSYGLADYAKAGYPVTAGGGSDRGDGRWGFHRIARRGVADSGSGYSERGRVGADGVGKNRI